MFMFSFENESQISKLFILHNSGLPTIYMPTHISSIINKPVIFRCRIESLVPFEMIWMKDGKPLERKRKYE